MIYNKITAVISMLFGSFNSSVGNLNASAPVEKKFQMFKVINFLSFWIFSFACIGIFFLGEDMIRIMTANNRYVLGREILIVTLLVFYLKVSKNSISIYRDTTGLFKLSKYALLGSAIINIILSFVFGYYWGLFGVLFATFVARMICDVWYEPYVLYKKIFKENVFKYFIEQVLYLIITIILVIIMYPIINKIYFDNLYIRFSVRFIVCTIIPNVVYLLIFFKKEEFIFVKNKLFEIIKKVIKKKGNDELNEKIY
jgi:O-antigen/teichoic acid export membrane protein